MKRAFKIIVFILLITAAASYYLWRSSRPVPVRTMILTPADMIESFSAQATVMPVISVVLNAGENGVVSELPFQVGNPVKAGEAVAILTGQSDTELELRLSQARQALSAARQEYNIRYGASGSVNVQIELAQNELNAAKWDLDAALSLNEAIPGTIPEEQINQLERILHAAEQSARLARIENSPEMKAMYLNRITACEEQIDALERSAGAEPVIAPFDGVLWELYAEKGQYAQKRQPLAKIYKKGQMKLEATVLAEDALGLTRGDTAKCSLANNESFDARISYISPVASKSLSVIGIEESRCRIELDPGVLPERIGAGHPVELTFIDVIAENALTAPLSAIVPLPGGGDGVYIIARVQEEGTESDSISGDAILAPVRAGKKAGGRVELLNGVNAGDILILNPLDEGIREGMKVSGQLGST